MLFSNHKLNLAFFTFTCTLLLAGACEEKINPEIEAKRVRDQEALQNICHADTDCFVTGCYQHACRAAPDETLCEHRIVVMLEKADDREALEAMLIAALGPLEGLTLRIGGYGAKQFLVSFHASLTQRQRIIAELEAIGASGFARLAPDTTALSRRLHQALESAGIDDLRLYPTQQIGELVEVGIKSGDILTLQDVEERWLEIRKIVAKTWPNVDFAYDVVMSPLPALRLWPIDKRSRLLVQHWQNFEINGTHSRMKIELSELHATWLSQWIDNGAKAIVLVLGEKVMTPMILKGQFGGPNVVLDMPEQGENDAHERAIDQIQRLSSLQGMMYVDSNATAKVERDIACHQQIKRECGCVAGHCQWHANPAYQKCIHNQPQK